MLDLPMAKEKEKGFSLVDSVWQSTGKDSGGLGNYDCVTWVIAYSATRKVEVAEMGDAGDAGQTKNSFHR